MRSGRIEQATQAWEDSQLRPGVFDLLTQDAEQLVAMHAEYVSACLQDVQSLCEQAWESGEIGQPGQLTLPLFARRT